MSNDSLHKRRAAAMAQGQGDCPRSTLIRH